VILLRIEQTMSQKINPENPFAQLLIIHLGVSTSETLNGDK